jgi:hypothetical protein
MTIYEVLWFVVSTSVSALLSASINASISCSVSEAPRSNSGPCSGSDAAVRNISTELDRELGCIRPRGVVSMRKDDGAVALCVPSLWQRMVGWANDYLVLCLRGIRGQLQAWLQLLSSLLLWLRSFPRLGTAKVSKEE